MGWTVGGATLFGPGGRPKAMANPIDDTLRREEWVLVQEVLAGRDFQRAFLSIWASDKREQRNLQKGLLGVL